jgi:cytochrome o ubiquinol oxidase subunit 2
MKKYQKIWAWSLLTIAVLLVTGWYLTRHLIPVLQPAGTIGYKERNLIIFCAAISVSIVVPVFALLGYFAWKYREDNHKASYSPELGGSRLAETIWWIVPTMLIAIISIVTWRSSYALDPFKPITTNKQVLHVQVVALDWKWLFIYPGQNVASVNEVAVPVGTPVDFEITSDAVMTSFWAPQLGGQMYAMPGMSTHLNLVADKPGSYGGVAANISGKGFAGMKFTVKAVSQQGYAQWMAAAKHAPSHLTAASYAVLSKPSENTQPMLYASADTNLYDTILMKYMMPMNTNTDTAMGMTQ